MFAKDDKVLKLKVSEGVCSGTVLEAWEQNNQGWIRVKWNDGPRVNCYASSVIYDTPENREMLEAKWQRRQERLAIEKVETIKTY